ncbi:MULTISPECIES: hypothetical protein [Aerococcus]|uniref:hypothetical protein n=1 Tax=Aerococcus TaxID=1375 RepID=UPI0015EB7381|nr:MULTISPECIES: hypothetical protein [Aerococcus]MDK8133221.1 hypothetical protein [Aerococcus urinae]MDK8485370.1 hypothetical protein [Aerococcus urinae]MDL5178307.1 hypothetical protein [Aerococcus tenax]MDL5207322.1 hypothetical protein [Aerococcus tenax]WIW73923.1 hypothetical protein DBT50_009345 [Aerococcus tenax]
MEDPNKLTRQELEEEYIARIKSESRRPETEEQRKLAAERKQKLKEMVKKLQQQSS